MNTMNTMNTIQTGAAVLLACATLCAACSGAQKVEETPPNGGMIEAGSLVERHARWLPKGALGVGVFAVDETISYVAERQVSDSVPERGAKIEARKRALRADLSREMAARFGVDLMGVHTVIVGASPTVQSVILLGARSTAGETVAISGVETFEVVPRNPSDKELSENTPYKPWAAELPGGEGVVVFLNRPQLNTLARSEDASLAASDMLTMYVEALNRAPSRVSFAMSVEGALEASVSNFEGELGFAPPRFGAFVLGDEMTVVLRDETESLERFDEVRKKNMERGIEKIRFLYEQAAKVDSAYAFSATFGYHAMLAIGESLVVTLADGELVYSAPGGLASYWIVTSLTASIAIPSFLGRFKSNKKSESEQIMRKLADGAKNYFMSDQKYQYDQPWHTSGEPGFPVMWEDYVFPGGADFSFQSSEELPTGGAKVVPDVVVDPKVEAALDKIGIDFNEPTYFRYTVTTGPGKGIEARITITAQADFKPGGPIHTVSQEITVDPHTHELIVAPMLTINEFE